VLGEILLVLLLKFRQADLWAQGLVLPLASLSLARPHPNARGFQTLWYNCLKSHCQLLNIAKSLCPPQKSSIIDTIIYYFAL